MITYLFFWCCLMLSSHVPYAGCSLQCPWITRPRPCLSFWSPTCPPLHFCAHGGFLVSLCSFWFKPRTLLLGSHLLVPLVQHDWLQLTHLWPSVQPVDLVPSTLGSPCSLSISYLFPVGQSQINVLLTKILSGSSLPFILLCPFPTRGWTGEKGRKWKIRPLGLPVVMPLWCPHACTGSSCPAARSGCSVPEYPGRPLTSLLDTQVRTLLCCHIRSRHIIWCHDKILAFPLLLSFSHRKKLSP